MLVARLSVLQSNGMRGDSSVERKALYASRYDGFAF
jgi:hypothetical protein